MQVRRRSTTVNVRDMVEIFLQYLSDKKSRLKIEMLVFQFPDFP